MATDNLTDLFKSLRLDTKEFIRGAKAAQKEGRKLEKEMRKLWPLLKAYSVRPCD